MSDVKKVSGNEKECCQEKKDDSGHSIEKMAILITKIPHYDHHAIKKRGK